MSKSATHSNWFNILSFALFTLVVPLYIVKEIVKHLVQVGFNQNHLIGFIALVVWYCVMSQLLLNGFMRLKVDAEEIIFEKPWQKWTWYRKTSSYLKLPSTTWEEMVIYDGLKNNAYLFFKNSDGLICIISTNARSAFVQAIQTAYPNKKFTEERSENFPKKVLKEMLMKHPERVMQG